jgi:hypothetical protein
LPGLDGNTTLILTPPEVLRRLAAMVRPTRVPRDRNFGMLVRTVASGQRAREDEGLQRAAAIVASEPERRDRRRSQDDRG